MRAVEYTSYDLQARISSGDLINIGDTVRVVKTDGTVHKFTVSKLSNTNIQGRDLNIAISDIARLEVKQFSATKNAIWIGAVVGIAALLSTAETETSSGNTVCFICP
ncbi:MAG: mechanosensitive ion channel [Gammaproteobacteria bacterium]|nr:mechanosensitive ion channel [Gammaproteobacteria bacterium]